MPSKKVHMKLGSETACIGNFLRPGNVKKILQFRPPGPAISF